MTKTPTLRAALMGAGDPIAERAGHGARLSLRRGV